jgi:hypothetical protein
LVNLVSFLNEQNADSFKNEINAIFEKIRGIKNKKDASLLKQKKFSKREKNLISKYGLNNFSEFNEVFIDKIQLK